VIEYGFYERCSETHRGHFLEQLGRGRGGRESFGGSFRT
jgi:hypothetical protein